MKVFLSSTPFASPRRRATTTPKCSRRQAATPRSAATASSTTRAGSSKQLKLSAGGKKGEADREEENEKRIEEEEEEEKKAPLELLSLQLPVRSSSLTRSLALFSVFLLTLNLLRPAPLLTLNETPNPPTQKKTFRKRNPLARFLGRHGASLSILLLITLGIGAAGHFRHARACNSLTTKLHRDITELQNEHGHARASGDATAQQVNALQHQLEETRRELAATRAASAERDRRLAEAEAAAHGHAATAHGASAETEALRSRADTLALSLAALERERDEARHLLEAEKALHLKKEAEWKAAEAAHGRGESYGGHQGDGDDDHTGFLQVAKLLEVGILLLFFSGSEREREKGATRNLKGKKSSASFSFLIFDKCPSPPFLQRQEQGVKHPQGHRAMASSLARFFEDQMASALATAERGEALPDMPVHDVSTKLISHLSHAGVASSHGIEHLFQTVDHLVDAALTHWKPPSASLATTQPHHQEDAGHHHDPHAAAHLDAAGNHNPHAAAHHEQHDAQHHDPHDAQHHDPHAAAHHDEHAPDGAHHGGHIDAHAAGEPHHAPAAADPHHHGQQQHHEEHHHHHKVDSSGFVM